MHFLTTKVVLRTLTFKKWVGKVQNSGKSVFVSAKIMASISSNSMPVTLRDIARHLNLSHATVSLVLNNRRDVSIPEATRLRVVEAARELGYEPNRAARALASGKTQMVALWTPPSYDSFYATILFHVQRLARESGYDMIYRQVVFQPESADVNLRSLAWPVDGILAVDSKYVLDHLAGRPEFAERAIVGIGAYSGSAFEHVSVDLEFGATEALSHLWSTGRRNIAFLRPRNPVDINDPRTSAYIRFCNDKGIDPQVIEVEFSDRHHIRNAVVRMAKQEGLPEAIFCYDDFAALAVMRGIKDVNLKVPEDCAVVGCDGSDETEFFDPPLTTIVQPVRQMCDEGWTRLLKRLRDPDLPRESISLKPTLAIRASTQRDL
jgi:DNA-binding LacI/PurR family transcriptional regulator